MIRAEFRYHIRTYITLSTNWQSYLIDISRRNFSPPFLDLGTCRGLYLRQPDRGPAVSDSSVALAISRTGPSAYNDGVPAVSDSSDALAISREPHPLFAIVSDFAHDQLKTPFRRSKL